MTELTINKGVLRGPNVTQYKTSKKSGGVNKKKFIVVHYTAGGSFANDVRTLSTSPAQVSCHLVISRDGEIAMIGNFDDIQWHAGASKWKGINGLNSYSIGIELTNPGWMKPIGNGRYQTHYGEIYSEDRLIVAPCPAAGSGQFGWLPYSAKQLQALADVVEALKKTYSTIEEVVGHEEISPGRKQDPGIDIILQRKFLDKLNGFGYDGSDNFYSADPDPISVADTTSRVVPLEGVKYRVITNGSPLRVREEPVDGKVIDSVASGETITVVELENGWAKLKSGGYVSAAYIEKT